MMLSNGKVAKMPDKLTDSDIVKDLNEAEDLENVLLYCKNPNKEVMTPIKITDIRDLINRLQAENERLSQFGGILLRNGSELFKEIQTAKAEAYKEIIKYLESRLPCKMLLTATGYECAIIEIKNLLKELVGEDKC